MARPEASALRHGYCDAVVIDDHRGLTADYRDPRPVGLRRVADHRPALSRSATNFLPASTTYMRDAVALDVLVDDVGHTECVSGGRWTVNGGAQSARLKAQCPTRSSA